MSILQRVDDFKRLWQLMLPTITMPDDQNIVRWLEVFTDTEIEYALSRTRRGSIFLPEAGPVVMYKYITGVLVNQRKTNAAGDVQ